MLSWICWPGLIYASPWRGPSLPFMRKENELEGYIYLLPEKPGRYPRRLEALLPKREAAA